MSKNYENLEEIASLITRRLCIVIDGPTLTLAFTEKKVANAFFKLGLMASSVVCCRVSPK